LIRGSQKGQAMVELALVLPVLFMLLLGIVDFGRVYHTNLVVMHSARQASREAGLGRSDAEIIDMARRTAMGLNTSNLTVTVSPPFSARSIGTIVTVTVSYPINMLNPLLGAVLPRNFVLVGRVAVRRG